MFFNRLHRLGYTEPFLNNMFQRANAHDKQKQTKKDLSTTVFLHLPYNPADPKSSEIQTIFKDTMLSENRNIKKLPDILDAQDAPMCIKNLTIAYSKNKSLRSHLFPRCFDKTAGPTASYYLNSPEFKHLFSKPG